MTKTTRRMARQPAEKAMSAVPASDTAAGTSTAEPNPTSKVAKIIALLQREEGATLNDLVAAAYWQKHTIRASLTGLKKKGHQIEKTKRGDVTCYRIRMDS